MFRSYSTRIAILLISSYIPCVCGSDFLFVSLDDQTIRKFDVSLSTKSAIEESNQVFVDPQPRDTLLTICQGMAFSSNGNLYALNLSSDSYTIFDPSGNIVSKSGLVQSLHNPWGIVFDSSGNFYIGNQGNNGSIVKFDSLGVFQYSILQNVDKVRNVAISPISGNIYATNYGNNTVSIFDSSSGAYISSISITKPQGITFDRSGNLYVANQVDSTISKFDSSGAYLTTFGSGFLNNPQSLAFDSLGYLYVANYNSQSVSKFDSSGNFLFSWSTGGSPRSIAFQPVPEPSTYFLVTIATGVLIIYHRKRSTQQRTILAT